MTRDVDFVKYQYGLLPMQNWSLLDTPQVFPEQHCKKSGKSQAKKQTLRSYTMQGMH
jgi:hypothetical protein